MQVSLNNTYYAGLTAMQVGQSRVDQAASQIASVGTEGAGRTQSTDTQLERLRAVDRSRESELGANLVEMTQGKYQVELGAKVEKAADERLGTLIDTFA